MNNSITARIETITPARAKELLERNTANRKVSPTSLAKIRAALTQGEWVVNGEAIKISTEGRILDGQHRLIACVETGINLETFIIEGLPDETQDTMDTGKARTLANVLEINGHSNTAETAALLTALERLQKWGIEAAAFGSAGYPVTVQQALRRLAKEPHIETLAKLSKRTNRIGLPGKISGLLYYVFSGIDAEDCQDFFDRLVNGNDLGAGHPILALRNRLMSLKEDGHSLRNYRETTAITIKAWNAYRNGAQIKKMQYRPGGANPEAFPQPV